MTEWAGRLRQLAQWLLLVGRYALVPLLIASGAEKVLLVDPAHPSPVDLIRPLGEMTGHEFLWRWMGTVPTYVLAVGWIEIAAGILLLFARTATLGAMLAVSTLMYMTVLHIGFPGPRAATDLARNGLAACIAALIVASDRQRLVDVFALNRPTVSYQAVFEWSGHPSHRRIAIVLASLALSISAVGLMDVYRRWSDMRHTSKLRGIYEVLRFERNGRTIPIEHRFPDRWRTVAIGDYADRVMIRTVGDRALDFDVAIDGTEEGGWRRRHSAATSGPRGILPLFLQTAGSAAAESRPVLQVEWVAADSLRFTFVEGDTLTGRLARVPMTRYPQYDPKWR